MPGQVLQEGMGAASCTASSPNPGPSWTPAGWAPSSELCFSGTKYATQFPCPRGYYNPDPLTQSLDSCLPCPPGHYCGQENLTQASGPCDAGACPYSCASHLCPQTWGDADYLLEQLLEEVGQQPG